MGALNVGRVGLDVVELDDITSWTDVWSFTDSRRVEFNGYLQATSEAHVRYLHEEFTNWPRSVVPVTWEDDASFDGFYVVEEAEVAAAAERLSYINFIFAFRLALVYVGSESQIEFAPTITRGIVTNSLGLTSTETFYMWPFNVDVHRSVITFSKSLGTTDGYEFYSANSTQQWKVPQQTDIASTVTFNPAWSSDADASTYYLEAAQIKVGGFIRQGLWSPNTPADWELSNGLVKVTPNSSLPQRIDVSHWSSGINTASTSVSFWATAQTWEVGASKGTSSSPWDSIVILENRPEVVSIMLTRQNPVASSYDREEMTITLRRGVPYVLGYNWSNRSLGPGALRYMTSTSATKTDKNVVGSTASSIMEASTITNPPFGGTAVPVTATTDFSLTLSTGSPVRDGFWFVGRSFTSTAVGPSLSYASTAADLFALSWLSEDVKPSRRG